VFPRYENNLEALIKSRCENYETPPTDDAMLPRLVSLLKRCWDKDPNLRFVSLPLPVIITVVVASSCPFALSVLQIVLVFLSRFSSDPSN
jgi:hypothetical protein